jgi:hypothetical protein
MPKQPTCHDCYFHRHGLCALALERPCPTFRAAGRTLEPPPQPTLVARAPLAAAALHKAAYAV